MRYDLLPVHGVNEACKVATSKLNKYAVNQWKYGMSWTEVLDSLKYHLSQFELGVDYTDDQVLHIAEVANNALILAEFYSTFPQGDDRIIAPVNKPIVCVDLDDTVFDFIGAYEKATGSKLANYWKSDYNMRDNLEKLDKDFWVNMPVIHTPTFEVDYYVTSRSIPIQWTQEAIEKNDLPRAEIYTLPWNTSKIETLKSLGCTIMIDDKYETFKECKANGIFCYLMDAPHNKHYNVGHHRIYDLNLNIK